MHRSAKEKKQKSKRKPPHLGRRWQLQDAKAQLSRVLRDAQKTPQIITLHGKEIAVVQSIEHYRNEQDAKAGKRPNIFEALLKCPKGPALKIERDENERVGFGDPPIFGSAR